MRLRCIDLSVSYGNGSQRVTALDGLSLECHEGEFLSVVGPSGSGKTTLLRAIADLLKPNLGSIERDLPPQQEPHALLVFQEHSLFPWKNVLDNAVFGLAMRGMGKPEREARAREWLRRFGLEDRRRAYPHQLSAGMKQRVAVIRAFLSEPDLLLMDEPFGALDAQTRTVLQEDLLSLWDQNSCSVIFVTHDLDEALLLSDRVVVLSRQPGKVIGEISVPFARPRDAGLALTEEFVSLKKRILDQLRGPLQDVANVG